MAAQPVGAVSSMAEQAALGSSVITDQLRQIWALPPQAIAGRATLAVSRRWRDAVERRRDIARGSYSQDVSSGALHILCDAVPWDQVACNSVWIDRIAALYLDHRFDLLGSGWVHVEHGVCCRGTEGIRYDPEPKIVADPEGQWLAGRISRANLCESQRLWRLIDPAYNPIDWQLDFKSGFRWPENSWSGSLDFGDLDGVDVKLPWELARMQHLVILAWAHRLCGSAESDGAPFVREFRNQVLDFIATNPPRFGINWRCSMDVAIRAANWVVAYGLFRAHGAIFDRQFETALERSLLDHGRHIALHLEFYPEGRANHYFADIAGLLFIAACLPETGETDSWLAFAIQELVGETAFQFNPDGSNFEGSTSYHRLSLEFATYATALVAGLPPDRLNGLTRDLGTHLRTRPKRPLARRFAAPKSGHVGRLERGAAFAAHTSRPNGNTVQIGDNDNGRFLKPHPVYYENASEAPPSENQLDHRGIIAAVHALSGNPWLAWSADQARLDGVLVRAFARDRKIAGDGDIDQAARCRIGAPDEFRRLCDDDAVTVELRIPGGQLRDGLALFGYPDFGIWIFRSRRLYLAMRCGPASSPRAGGSHAHNDQLAIELMIDNEPWITDPGSYLYCPPLGRRNRWRSVTAHAAPQWPGREPNPLDLGAFRLRDQTQARCLYFGPLGFAGEHVGYGTPVRRLIALDDDFISISDCGLPAGKQESPTRCVGKLEAQRHFATFAPFSPGYGEIQSTGAL
ncbi:MAG: heparinase II/III family protein [Proteobacteria bacterium]|nr:heparinase II/III family protein [Pseudomonadota bacterium]